MPKMLVFIKCYLGNGGEKFYILHNQTTAPIKISSCVNTGQCLLAKVVFYDLTTFKTAARKDF